MIHKAYKTIGSIWLCQVIMWEPFGFADGSKSDVIYAKNFQEVIETYKNVKKNKHTLEMVTDNGDMNKTDDAVLLSTKTLNKLRHFSFTNKTIRVQSGVTWRRIQEYVNKYGLSTPAVDLSLDQTVADSISQLSLILEPNTSSIAEHIKSVTYLAPDGRIKRVSPEREEQMFSLIIGGHHLLGVILEAEIKLGKNTFYKRYSQIVHYHQYINHLTNTVLNNQSAEIHQAYFNLQPGDHFLRTLQADTYVSTSNLDSSERVQASPQLVHAPYLNLENVNKLNEKNVNTKLSTDDVKIARNSLLRSPEIQELQQHSRVTYIIPLESFNSFVDQTRTVLKKNQVDTVAVKVSYVPGGDKRYLFSDVVPSTAFSIYTKNTLENDKHMKVNEWVVELSAIAHQYNGYVTLANAVFTPRQQIANINTKQKKFFELKQKFDPDMIFTSVFYSKYRDLV